VLIRAGGRKTCEKDTFGERQPRRADGSDCPPPRIGDGQPEPPGDPGQRVRCRCLNNLDLSGYDLLVFGASIYVGKMQADMVDFINTYREALADKPQALFVALI